MVVAVTAFIPARAGSKGVPAKNLRLVNGQPLIKLAIDCARTATGVSQIVVTSDCPECLMIARRMGVTAIDRPPALAQDDTPTFPVIRHAIEELLRQSMPQPDVVLLLQPTSPLRTGQHVSEALSLFTGQTVKSVTSVCAVDDEHPARMYAISDGILVPVDPGLERLRRQDLPPVFRRNGAIYAIRTEEMLRIESLIGDGAVPYVMPRDCSVNVDSELDLMLANLVATAAHA